MYGYFQSFEEVHLTHFQYTEWPGGEGEGEEQSVPSSTHGLLGLVEHALAHQELASLTGPIAVHCRLVALPICTYFLYVLLTPTLADTRKADAVASFKRCNF